MVVRSMTTNLWFHLSWIVLLGSVLILILSIILSRYEYRRDHRETKWFSADYYFSHAWSFTIGILTIVGILCGLVFLPVNYLKRAEFYASEEVEYQNAVAYHDSLIDALNHTDNIHSSDKTTPAASDIMPYTLNIKYYFFKKIYYNIYRK